MPWNLLGMHRAPSHAVPTKCSLDHPALIIRPPSPDFLSSEKTSWAITSRFDETLIQHNFYIFNKMTCAVGHSGFAVRIPVKSSEPSSAQSPEHLPQSPWLPWMGLGTWYLIGKCIDKILESNTRGSTDRAATWSWVKHREHQEHHNVKSKNFFVGSCNCNEYLAFILKITWIYNFQL